MHSVALASLYTRPVNITSTPTQNVLYVSHFFNHRMPGVQALSRATAAAAGTVMTPLPFVLCGSAAGCHDYMSDTWPASAAMRNVAPAGCVHVHGVVSSANPPWSV